MRIWIRILVELRAMILVKILMSSAPGPRCAGGGISVGRGDPDEPAPAPPAQAPRPF